LAASTRRPAERLGRLLAGARERHDDHGALLERDDVSLARQDAQRRGERGEQEIARHVRGVRVALEVVDRDPQDRERRVLGQRDLVLELHRAPHLVGPTALAGHDGVETVDEELGVEDLAHRDGNARGRGGGRSGSRGRRRGSARSDRRLPAGKVGLAVVKTCVGFRRLSRRAGGCRPHE
jgi:hypothetical protein